MLNYCNIRNYLLTQYVGIVFYVRKQSSRCLRSDNGDGICQKTVIDTGRDSWLENEPFPTGCPHLTPGGLQGTWFTGLGVYFIQGWAPSLSSTGLLYPAANIRWAKSLQVRMSGLPPSFSSRPPSVFFSSSLVSLLYALVVFPAVATQLCCKY